MYPSRRFDVLGLVQRRRQGGQAGQRDSGAPGLGVYSAWLGGLPGFLSGVPLPTRIPNVYRPAIACLHGFRWAWQSGLLRLSAWLSMGMAERAAALSVRRGCLRG